MAADYWASTQRRHWQFSRDNLDGILQRLEDQDKDLVQQFVLPVRRLLNQYFNQQIAKLGKRMSIRQQALATAQIYLKRFYCKVEIRRTNPYLVMATALYLACKMEECPQHIRVIVSEARSTWPGMKITSTLDTDVKTSTAESIVSDITKIGECEFFLISEMNSQLIIHHPYRALQVFQGELEMTQDDVSLAWSIINDHYLTDAPLLYAPHIIAVTAIVLAVTLKPASSGSTGLATHPSHLDPDIFLKGSQASGSTASKSQQTKCQNLANWLAKGEVDMKTVADCCQEIISLYDILEQYNEKVCKEQIARFIRFRGLDK